MGKPQFIDLFAGCGGLSEGFIRAGFTPVAHVEMDKGACNTLRTRMAYHWLKEYNNLNIYHEYLKGNITRDMFYNFTPDNILNSVINKEINNQNNKKIIEDIYLLKGNKKIDLIIGGPPCQAYSLVGRSRDKRRMQGDARNYLYIQYAEFLNEFKPEFFIFENVIGLLSARTSDNKKYFDEMIRLFHKCGYTIEYRILDASNYGVLQKRQRIIMIGRRGRKDNFFPDLLIKKYKKIKVCEIFKDLPKLKAGRGKIKFMRLHRYYGTYLFDAKIKNELDFITWHIARPHTDQDKAIYKIVVEKWRKQKVRLHYNDLPEELKTHKNRKTFSDRFKVVAGNIHYAHTVVAHIAKDGHYYIHPDIRQNRSLTPREVARLQSFPDDYYFESITEKYNRTSVFRQIGNAVPALLSEKIAEGIMEIIR